MLRNPRVRIGIVLSLLSLIGLLISRSPRKHHIEMPLGAVSAVVLSFIVMGCIVLYAVGESNRSIVAGVRRVTWRQSMRRILLGEIGNANGDPQLPPPIAPEDSGVSCLKYKLPKFVAFVILLLVAVLSMVIGRWLGHWLR